MPTTADVTRLAHGAGLSAQRAFPSTGLNFGQLVANAVVLRADPPPARHGLALTGDVRLSPDTLHARAVELGLVLIRATRNALGLAVSSRITRLPRYVRQELLSVGLAADVLGRTRLALWETVPPMSLHIGVVRFGFGAQPLMDVLFDTTDSAPNLRAFCHVTYEPALLSLVAHVSSLAGFDFGVAVRAF